MAKKAWPAACRDSKQQAMFMLAGNRSGSRSFCRDL